jgi:hypothetical protein
VTDRHPESVVVLAGINDIHPIWALWGSANWITGHGWQAGPTRY